MSEKPKLAYSMREASDATGLSSSYLSAAIHRGELRTRRSSRAADGEPQGKYVIMAADLEAFLDSLPEG